MHFPGFQIASAACLLLTGPALAQDEGFGPAPELRPYLRHAASAAALVSAIAMVDDCRAPLEFEPGDRGEFTTLMIACRDMPDQARQVTLVFRVHARSGDFAYLEPVDIQASSDVEW